MTSTAGARYVVDATVIESAGDGPRLCFWVLDSLPPGCDDPVVREVVGLDWAAVPAAESLQGTTWADLRLVGTWDGEAQRFTVTEPPGEADVPSPGAMAPFEIPCPEPEGGWDRAPADPLEQDAAAAWLQGRTDISAVWLASPDGSFDWQVLVVRVADGGALAEVEAGVRQRYTGPLCVVSGGRPQAELEQLVSQVEAAVGDEHLGIGVNSVAGHVEVNVVLATPELEAALDEQFGEGTVELVSALRPADEAGAGLVDRLRRGRGDRRRG